MKRLHALQYLRAIAALLVVYSHATLQVPAWESFLPYTGAYGVDIFFVISGFIMVYITKPDDTAGRFLVQRIRRVVPLYWFFTLLMGAILFLLPSLFKTGEFSWLTLFQSLFFIPHYSLQNPDYIWPIVAPGWSLMYEMYFYILFAASLFVPQKFRVPCVISAIIVIWAVCGSSGSQLAIPKFVSDPSVFEFVAGMLLAVAWKRGFELPSSAGWMLIAAGFASATFTPDDWHHWVRISLPSTLIVIGFLYISVPVSRIGLLLGDASYALYLSHIFVLGGLRVFVPDNIPASGWYAWGFVLLSLVVCTIVGIVVHFAVDNWLLRRERFTFLRSTLKPVSRS